MKKKRAFFQSGIGSLVVVASTEPPASSDFPVFIVSLASVIVQFEIPMVLKLGFPASEIKFI